MLLKKLRSTMNREIVIRWLEEAQVLEPGESLFLPGETREHSRELVRLFKAELKIMAEIDPVAGNRVQVHNTIKDQRYWVELKRTYGNPLLGFKRDKDGNILRKILIDPDRKRRLMCMKEDGMTLAEAEAIEGELTDEEKEVFK